MTVRQEPYRMDIQVFDFVNKTLAFSFYLYAKDGYIWSVSQVYVNSQEKSWNNFCVENGKLTYSSQSKKIKKNKL